MAMIHEPLQEAETGLWRMVAHSDEESFQYEESCCKQDVCNGHATAHEATLHYHQWLAEHAILRPITPDLCQVSGCGKPAAYTVGFPGCLALLLICSEHQDQDSLLRAIRRE